MAKPTLSMLRKLMREELPKDLIATSSGWCWNSGPNFGVIELQLDKYSTADTIGVAVNVGVYSALLASFFDGVDFKLGSLPPTDTTNCALRDRLGSPMPGGQDLWWTVSLSNIHQVALEIAGLLTRYGIPFITSRLDDSRLVEEWSSLLHQLGYKELRFLAVLACSLNAKDVMNEALDALEEKWGRKEMVLDLSAFAENLRKYGLDAKPVLSESALALRRQIDEKRKKTQRSSK